MPKSLAVLSLFLALISVNAVNMRSSSTDDDPLASLKALSSDYIVRINSTDISTLAPGEYMIEFQDPCPGNPTFDYKNQLFFVYLPTNYQNSTNQTLGIIAFISHTNQWGMWSLYKSIFDERNLIYFVAQNTGNMVEDAVRQAAAMAGITYFNSALTLDPTRIYAAGLSGGGRIACQMAWDNGTLISGAIGVCGCDYKRLVTLSAGADPSYGFYVSSPVPDDVLRLTTRVVIVTGSEDFLQTNLNDIYNNGIVADNLTGWIIDVTGMGHEMADYITFDQALTLVDNNPPKCNFPCKDCSESRYNCTECFDSLDMTLVFNETTTMGSCVALCEEGTYAYNGYCINECPEWTAISNDGYQDTCIERTEISSETTSDESEQGETTSEE